MFPLNLIFPYYSGLSQCCYGRRNEKKGSGEWGCCGYVRVLMLGLDTFSSSGEKREGGTKHMGHYVGLGGDVVLDRRRLGVV